MARAFSEVSLLILIVHGSFSIVHHTFVKTLTFSVVQSRRRDPYSRVATLCG